MQGKKISSYDYDAWSKFDVEKALENIEESTDDAENNPAQNSEITPEILLQKAVVEKEKGNEHFKVNFFYAYSLQQQNSILLTLIFLSGWSVQESN